MSMVKVIILDKQLKLLTVASFCAALAFFASLFFLFLLADLDGSEIKEERNTNCK